MATIDSQPPPFFVRGPSPLARLVFFATLAVACMVVDARFQYLGALRQLLSVAAYPLQQLALVPSETARRVAGFFVTQRKLQQENDEAKLKLMQQSHELQRYQALEAELNGLRRLLGARGRAGEKALLVEVLHASRDPFSRKIAIDKGSIEGIQAGQAVVDADGVVGQVTRVFPLSSEVTLITEKNQPVPVMVQRNGLRVVVFGSGRLGTLELPFVPVNADLQNGDVLVTSGIDGTYPPGLPVATITNIERNAAYIFSRITCTPSAGVGNNKHYLVLTGAVAHAPAAQALP